MVRKKSGLKFVSGCVLSYHPPIVIVLYMVGSMYIPGPSQPPPSLFFVAAAAPRPLTSELMRRTAGGIFPSCAIFASSSMQKSPPYYFHRGTELTGKSEILLESFALWMLSTPAWTGSASYRRVQKQSACTCILVYGGCITMGNNTMMSRLGYDTVFLCWVSSSPSIPQS